MLFEHKEHNPNAIFFRVQTLGSLYKIEQIKKRIVQYQGTIINTPRTKIKAITKKLVNGFIQDAIGCGNMKIANIAKNSIVKYGITPENLLAEVTALFARSSALSREVSSIKSPIESGELEREIKEYRQLQLIYDGYAALKGVSRRSIKRNISASWQLLTQPIEIC